MKTIPLFMMTSLLLGGVACKSGSERTKDGDLANTVATDSVVDMHTAEISLDYPGVYKGTIPAASGPGINITLSLNKNKTFKMISDYIDEKDGVFADSGRYEIDGNIITLIEKDSPDRYLKVEEGKVRMLDADKQVVKGALENNYILTQDSIF